MSNPLKILTSLSASYGAAISGSDGLKVQQGGLTVSAGTSTFAGTTISDLGAVTTADINGGTIDGAEIATSNITVGSGKTLNVSAGTLTLAAGQVGADKVAAGTFAAGTYSFAGSTISAATAITASALDISNQAAVGSLTVGGGYGSTGVSVSAAGNIQANGTLTVDSTSTLTGDVTFGGNIVADANENKSIFAAVTSNTITIGASGATVSVPGTASIGGNLTISGDLTVNGTTTTVSSQNVTIKDKNVILAVPDGGAAATDSGADGGGITLSGSTDKSFQWSNATDSWTSSEHLDLASGKAFKIGTVEAVKQTSFSQGVDNDSTTLAITGSQLVSGSSTAAFIGVGAGTAIGMGPIGDAVLLKGDVAIVRGESLGVKIEASGSGQGGVTIGAYGDGETITLTGSAGSVTLSQLVTAVGGGTSLSKANYYSARNAVVAHNNSGSTSDVIFNFYLSPAAPEGQFSGENWEFHRITGLSGSTEADCLNALGYASVDVITRDNGASNWTNDLVSVKVEASSSSGVWYPKITVSAPALTRSVNTKIRLILINESQTSVG